MRPRERPLKVLCLLGGLLLATWLGIPCVFPGVEPEVVAQEKKPDAFAGDVRPLLTRYCAGCHGENKPKGGLNLTAQKGAAPAQDWKKVWDRVRSRQMPPVGQPQLTLEERTRLTAWLEGVFARHTIDGQPDPGPLRPRRLNVREYRNTLRDLVVAKDRPQPRRASYTAKPDGSINLYQIYPPPEHPCAFVTRTLPQDTSDGGFDTIGENLSIPPFLMEKYLRACSTTTSRSRARTSTAGISGTFASRSSVPRREPIAGICWGGRRSRHF
jgi:mono/diheme cytochrome c family protein